MNRENFTEESLNGIKGLLAKTGIPIDILNRYDIIIYPLIILATAFLIAEIVYRISYFFARHILQHKEYSFLDKILKHNALRRLTHIIPPIIINMLLPIAFENKGVLLRYLENLVWIYLIVSIVRAVIVLLNIVAEMAFTKSKYHNRPIKGLLQISKIIVYIITAIIVLSILTNRSPLYLIGGLGAFAAVLMLITKDSIMGFVGGFLLLENDMVRLGDWIEIPGTAINGTVTDISLTIVKVRNFDNTIATIPPYSLINESFINWRGMSESGGRRISRGFTLKIDNIQPCSRRFLERMKKFDNELCNYIITKEKEKASGNIGNPSEPVDGNVETNAGLFRAYAEFYLRRHPHIRKDMLIMVRTMTPTDTGLPLQFYCFTKTTDWQEYESIQSGIMEHFASVMPVFELYPFQSTSSRDTIISGLLEGNFPPEHITGLPFRTTK
ncbi:MAG: mechanosensitive ion channel [Bacteroidaceae bacterium]|nr:mechanosensitive ion channel [Bacteroidaceae bacterium]MBQ8270557.1 mechanosensitive ion channel [Bacteroidaceae bacterium]